LEADETIEQTARREVAEETGWSLEKLVPLGVLHFHQSKASRDGVQRDFLQAVFAAEANSFDARTRELEGYELDAQFMPLEEGLLSSLTERERLLIDAGIMALAESNQ
jgi:8-oxo-dGTP pyrophosphatase MutT (NUDIX family)